MKKILLVVGGRPNFIKIRPLLKELKKSRKFKYALVHTGQHYDFRMSQIFFQELKIPKPRHNLNVGSDSPVSQLAKIIERLEKVILAEKPDLVAVVGDINSTLAGALTASKMEIPIVHIEAGLRSFNRKMPEEINRVIVDHLSDFLFVSDPAGIKNLIKEGVPKNKIFYAGNIMIDTLKNFQFSIFNFQTYKKFGLEKKNYAVLTLHRSENVDNKEIFRKIINILEKIKIKIIWPLHPRDKKQIIRFGLLDRIKKIKNLEILNPLGYLDFLSLINKALVVLTDSGGVQEETTFLNVPCLTLREETERPITVSQGTNIIVGTDEKKIIGQINKILKSNFKKTKPIRYWDGKTAKRILKVLEKNI